MISIIVPIYNVEKYLKKCVNSILNQTYKNLEVILVDDGSPDRCPEICDDFAFQDKRVKVIHKENGGLISARQAGLRAASGEYIGFVDGDDWIEPDMYMNFYDSVVKYSPDIVVSEFIFDYETEKVKSSQNLTKPFFSKQEMINEIYPSMLFKPPYYNFGIYPCCWAKLYKKELLEKCLFKVTPKIKIGEDSAFTYPCLIQANSLAYVDKYGYHYMNNPDSMTGSYDSNMENTILIPYNILKKAFSENNYNFSSSLNYYLFYLLEFIIRNEASSRNKKTKKEIKKTLKAFICNKEIASSMKNIKFSALPLRKKLILVLILLKNTELLYLCVRLYNRLAG